MVESSEVLRRWEGDGKVREVMVPIQDGLCISLQPFDYG
jgi:hypothetical protein